MITLAKATTGACIVSARKAVRIAVSAYLVVAFHGPPRSHGQDLQHVLDVRFPGPGVVRFTADAFTRTYPVVVGDVNGDGADDLIARPAYAIQHVGPMPSDWSLPLIMVFGGSHLREPPADRLEALSHSRFVEGDRFTGFFAEWRERPFTRLGDVDGDGFDDLGMGALSLDWQGIRDAGQVRIIFGQPQIPREIPLEDPGVAGMRSLRIVAAVADLKLGRGLEGAGDLNGDGSMDIAIAVRAAGTEDAQMNAGRVYVLLDLAALIHREEVGIESIGSDLPGLVLHGALGHPRGDRIGALGDNLGHDRSMAPGGDVNADGIDDLLIGAPFASRGLDRNGVVYVLFGRRDLGGELFAARPEEFGVEILGGARVGNFGLSVGAAGDIDGDGAADFVVGEPGDAFLGEGAAYLIFGRSDWPRGRTPLADLRHLEIRGSLPQDFPPQVAPHLGTWVAGAGDQDGDGAPDFLVSKPRDYGGFGTGVGSVFLVFGGASLPKFSMDTAIGTPELPGLRIQGKDSFYELGWQGAAGGDLDGDGRQDFVVVSHWWDFLTNSQPPPPSELHIFFGGAFDVNSEIPALGSVEPSEGSVLGGTRVFFRGSGFREGLRVFFDGVEGTQVAVTSTAEAEAVAPPGKAVGSVDLEVVVGDRSARLPSGFRYVAAPGHPDLVLDPEWLTEHGYRTIVIQGVSHRPEAYDIDGDGFTDLAMLAFERFEARSHVWLLRGRASWPAAIGFEEMFDLATLIESEADPGGFARYVTMGGDFDRDGVGDLAIGGTVDLPVSDPATASGKAYLVLSAGRRWSDDVVNLPEALDAGEALSFPHSSCGHIRVATLSTPQGEGILATSHLFCRGLAAELKLYRSPLDPKVLPPRPVSIIRGDPSVPFINPFLGDDDGPLLFGAGLASAGDLNGDGWDDLLASAYGGAGECYLLLMSPELLDFEGTIVDLLKDGRAVRVRRGIGLTDFGIIVSTAMDFNGDGLSDAILPAVTGGGDEIGETFVVFGSRDLGTAVREIDLLERSSTHLRIVGEFPGDVTGTSFGIGDWNQDGYDDVAVFGVFNRNRTIRDRFYVVFGEAEPPPEIRLRTLGHRGFRVFAAEGRRNAGGRENRPIGAGDFDGDGFPDIAVHDYNGEVSTREEQRITVIFGKPLSNGRFVRGRINADDRIDLSDAVALLSYLFLGGVAPACLDAADANDSGTLDLSDPVSLLNFLFLGGPSPPPPYPKPGADPTADGLECL